MARPVNIIPSMLLVFVGACCAAQSLAALLIPRVWLLAFASAAIAVSSVVVNDYFDFKEGVDATNAPNKPLPRGIVSPDGALLLAAAIYVATLMVACLLSNTFLRLIVAAAAGVTLAYTPWLKRVTFLKNLAVAFVIAASPITGALSTGLGSVAAARMLPSIGFLFWGIVHREMLMDMNDRDGDAAAGVMTLPVRFGAGTALMASVACLCGGIVGSCYVVARMHVGTSLAYAVPGGTCSLFAVLLAVVVYLTRSAFSNSWHIYKRDFEPVAVEGAIAASFQPIGAGLLAFAILAAI